MSWLTKHKKNRINPEDLHRQADESLRQVTARQEDVNMLSRWLIWRSNENGFGDDIEWTLKSKGAA